MPLGQNEKGSGMPGTLVVKAWGGRIGVFKMLRWFKYGLCYLLAVTSCKLLTLCMPQSSQPEKNGSNISTYFMTLF